MNFEELKVIWDAQSREHVFAIDRASLHALVRRRARGIDRYVGVFEIAMIAIMGVLGAATLAEPILYGHDAHQIPGGLLSLLVAGYLVRLRVRRRHSERGFDDSVLGELDRAIAQIDYQIERLRTFVWWFIVPVTVGSLISFIVLHDSKPAWIWPLTLAAMVLAWLAMRRDLRSQLPRKRELEAVRARLAGLEPGGPGQPGARPE